MQETKGRNIMGKLFLETKIRLNVSQNLIGKINIFCYEAYRMFQDLPTKGQRTHGNAEHLLIESLLIVKYNPDFYKKEKCI